MIIKDEKKYNEIEERMEALLAKGTQLGGMDFLSEVEKGELKVLSEAAYDWECEVDPHPWRVKPSLIAAIKVAFRQKGYKQKEAAKAIGVSTTALSDILHGRRAINFEVARNIYHNLGVPANVVLGKTNDKGLYATMKRWRIDPCSNCTFLIYLYAFSRNNEKLTSLRYSSLL